MATIDEKPKWSKDGKTLSNVLLKGSNLYGTYNVVTTWYDGTPMTDVKLDSNLVYVKYDGKYLVQNLQYGQVLQKDTMAQMRSMSTLEVLLLKMGVYKHVQLNGYYEKGDTPSPIDYYLSNTNSSDDGYSIIEINNIKVNHNFNGKIHLSYAGVKGNRSLNDESIIQNVINSKPKIIIFPTNKEVLLQVGLKIERSVGITLDGEYCWIGFEAGSDGTCFTITGINEEAPLGRVNMINIKRFVTSNLLGFGTFINCKSAHHLHVEDNRTDGTKLFIKSIDSYFMTVSKNLIGSINQAFDFRQATNSFTIIGNSIHGQGVASYFEQNTTGGVITGNAFEDKSGKLHFGFGNFGISIIGNYFEGYKNESNVNNNEFYIKIDGGGGYKECRGFNISGNLFYSGAEQAIDLFASVGLDISGNHFNTKHAIRYYCFDGVRQDGLNYKGNSWFSDEINSTEVNYYGSKKDGIISSDNRHMIRFLPTDNAEVENKDDDYLEYNEEGVPKFKSYNIVFTKGWSTTLFSKVTVQNQVEDLNFNLKNLSPLAKIYIFGGSSDNSYNEYTLIKSSNNSEGLFVKNNDSFIEGLNISIRFDGKGIVFSDDIGGRFLNILVSG